MNSHIDGIDVEQLLREIGEASARTNAVALFGLLLSAQRVLAQMQTSQNQQAGTR